MSKSAIRPNDPPPTAEQEKQITYWLSRGAIPDTALARAGVPRSLYQRWLKAGAAGEEPYASFVARVESALVLFECKLLEMINDNANKNVAAAQWLLMLRFRYKYEKVAKEEAGLAAEVSTISYAAAEVSEEDLEAAERRALAAQKHVENTKPKALMFGLEDKTKH